MGSLEKAFPADPVTRIKTIREELGGCGGHAGVGEDSDVRKHYK